MPEPRTVATVLMRGGTSKAAVFHAGDLPADPAERDRLLLRWYGSPDPYGRQLDGIGGGSSSTSKAAVVGPSDDPRADVDYLFLQVGVDRAEVDTRGNCGNISATVGPYAIDAGLVQATGRETRVRIRNLNTDSIIVAHVRTRDGRFDPAGDLAIPGVPGTGSAIRLDFEDPAGAVTGALLPSGAVTDLLDVGGRRFRVSIVDAANPVVFVAAAELGLEGGDAPDELERVAPLVAAIRAAGAVRAGMIPDLHSATTTPAVPRVAIVAPPSDYRTRTGETIDAGRIDILASMFSMGRPHAAYPFTGAIATAVAARLEGSVVHEIATSGTPFRIGHPAGVQTMDAQVTRDTDGWHVPRVTSYRTARRLMIGRLEIPEPQSHEGEL